VSTGSPEASRARFRGGIAKCGDECEMRRRAARVVRKHVTRDRNIRASGDAISG
jgi:hypothetical protein